MSPSPVRGCLALLLCAATCVLLLLSPGEASGQGSHRRLDPPANSTGDLANRAELLLQLQRIAEQMRQGDEKATSPNRPGRQADFDPEAFDPSRVDPKLLDAMQNLAEQVGDEQIPPPLSDWLRQARAHRSASLRGNDERSTPSTPSDQPRETPENRPPARRGPRPDRAPAQQRPPGTGERPDGPSPRQPPDLDSNPNEQAPPGRSPVGEIPFRRGDTPPQGVDDARRQAPSTGERGGKTPRNAVLEGMRDSQMSLKEQLSRVVEHARREAILQRSSDDEKPGRLAAMLDESLAKTSRELARNLGESRRTRASNRSESQRSPRRRETQQRNRAIRDQFKRLSSQADQLTKAITNAELPPATAPESPAASPEGGSQAQLAMAVLALVLLAALLGAGYLWQARRRRTLAEEEVRRVMRLPAEMLTRDDVLRAFHALASLTEAARHPWWTHRQAGRALIEASPQARRALEALVAVYEQARYLPADEPLHSEQLGAAQHALRLCRIP